jgi:hypothetical protein
MEPPDGGARIASTTPQDSIKRALRANSNSRKWATEQALISEE